MLYICVCVSSLACKVPSERWRQGAALFDDNTMIVYGGYSQRCGDYCDDVWSFDLRDNTWMEIYPLGHFAEGLSGCMLPGFPAVSPRAVRSRAA